MTIKATFEVTCAREDDKAACARIKALMHDCEVGDAKPTAAYTHYGIREFENDDHAIARMLELQKLAGKDMLDISVRVVR